MAEAFENKQEIREQAEQTMNAEQRDRLIEEYSRCIEDALREGSLDMVNYYKEKAAALKEARNQERQEYWENKRQQRAQEAAELQQRIQESNIERRTPNYGTPTTEEGWRHQAEIEFSKRGESWYYDVCMKEAAKCHVDEALDGK